MKFFKMSLAAVVAAGALTSIASATSLEDAIKNVDVSGMGRYRFDSYHRNSKFVDGTGTVSTMQQFPAGSLSDQNKKDTFARHRFTSVVDFRTALDDNFYGIIGFRYESQDISGDNNYAATAGTTNVGDRDRGLFGYGKTFEVRQFALGYKVGNTTIQAGRQVIGAFFTDDMVGTGIKIVNTDAPGLTLAAIAYDDLENDANISSAGLKTYQNNLYGVAAIGSYDPVSFQLWYAMLDNVAQMYAGEIAANANVTPDINIGGKAQYAGAKVENQFKKDYPGVATDDSHFWAFQASVGAYGFDANAGYISFGTKKDKVSFTSFEDQASFISPDEDLFDYTLYAGKNRFWFLNGGYNFLEKYRVEVDWVDGYNKISGEMGDFKTKESELVGRFKYAYSKKLGFQAFWSHIEDKYPDSLGKDKVDHFRFEAQYTF